MNRERLQKIKVSDLTNVDGWECISAGTANAPISAAYTSDLLSDVMANAPEDSVLITLQAHLNTVAVAALADVRAIIICHARPIPDDMIAAAQREGILLLRTKANQFDTTVKCYRLLTGDYN